MSNDKQIFNCSDDALCYLTECTMSTVEQLADKKSATKGELARQRSLAEIGMLNRRCIGYEIRDARAVKCFRVATALGDKS